MVLAHAFLLLLGVLYPLLAAKKDATMILAHDKINHKINALIRVVVFGLAGAASILPIAIADDQLGQGIVMCYAYNALVAGIFWLLFDRRLNKLRGLNLNYTSIQPDGAATDRFIVKLAMRMDDEIEDVQLYVKLFYLALATLGYAGSFVYYYFYL